MSRITIEEIGKKAGVSKTTVSLIINEKSDKYRISSKTREKVFKVIEENDFVINQQAKNFRLKKTFTIGLIIPDFKNPFFTDLISELEIIGRERDYIYLIGTSNDDQAKEIRIIDRFTQHNVDGFIIASASENPEKSPPNYVPSIYIDRKVNISQASSITSNNFESAKQITNFLLNNGLNNILFLNGKENLPTSVERKNGFTKALNEHGLAPIIKLMLNCDHNKESGFKKTKEFFEVNIDKPNCIFTASWAIMEGVLEYIKLYPNDFLNTKLATFDHNTAMDYLPYRSVSIQQNTREIAIETIDMLLNMISGSKIQQNKIIESVLITKNF